MNSSSEVAKITINHTHTSLPEIITLYDLQSALEKYEKEKSYFESMPDFIQKLQQLAKKNKLDNADELEILRIIAGFSQLDQHCDGKNCLNLIYKLSYHIGNEKIDCAQALIKENLFNIKNIANLSRHPFLFKNIIFLHLQKALTQDSIDLLLHSVSSDNPEHYLIFCTDHLSWLVAELQKHHLLDKNKYEIIYANIQDNLEEKIILESNTYSKNTNIQLKVYEWSKSISKALIIDACKNFEYDFEKNFVGAKCKKYIENFCGIKRMESESYGNNYCVYYLKALQLMERYNLHKNPKNIDILFKHCFCFDKFIAVMNLCDQNKLLNTRIFRELCELSLLVSEMFTLESLIRALSQYKVLSGFVLDIIVTTKNMRLNEQGEHDYIFLDKDIYQDIINFVHVCNQHITSEILAKILLVKRTLDTHIFNVVYQYDFINQDIFNQICNKIIHSPDDYLKVFHGVIVKLHQYKEMNVDFLNILFSTKTKKECENMQSFITRLYHNSMLSTKNLQDVILYHQEYEGEDNRNVYEYMKSLYALKKEKLLNYHTRKIIYYNPYSSQALILLSKKNLLQNGIIDLIYNKCEELWFIQISTLNAAGLLNEKNLYAFLSHNNLDSLIRAIKFLDGRNKLTQDALSNLFLYQNPLMSLHAMNHLRDKLLFNYANHDRFIKHPNQARVAISLTFLEMFENFNLAQHQLNAIFTYGHIFSSINPNIFTRIPAHLFNTRVFDEIMLICTLNSENINLAQQRLEEYIEQLLNPRNQIINPNNINTAQSTHTRSIHKSVSESAIELHNLYGHKIATATGLTEVLQEIKIYVGKLPGNLKNDAAKRAINSLGRRIWSHEDPVAMVTNLQLLALAWLAIHDDSKRNGGLDVALDNFIDGLYEIQRGYNLDDTGLIDNGQKDKVICSGGTFNKIIEKLWGIHKDVELVFITKDTAINKLSVLVKNKCAEYLEIENLSVSELESLYIKFQNDDEVESLWKQIYPDVYTDMEEYASAFGSKEEFIQFIDSGLYKIYNFLDDVNSKIKSIKQNSGVTVFKTEAVVIENEPENIGGNIRKENIEDKILSPVIDVTLGSTYRIASNAPQHFKRKSQNADVFSVAIMSSGLPIAIILDGTGSSVTNASIQKSASFLTKHFQRLSALVEGRPVNENSLKKLAVQAFMDADKEAQGKCDTAAIAIIVQFHNDKGDLQYLALGCGDCMVLHNNGCNVETIIAAKNDCVQDKKIPLTFGARGTCSNEHLQRTYANLTIRSGSITPNSRFILMTDGAYENLEMDVINDVDDTNHPVCITSIRNPDIFLNKTPHDLAMLADEMADKKLRENQCHASGDDILIASIAVPTETKQGMLKALCAKDDDERARLCREAAKASLNKLNLSFQELYNNKAADSLYQTLFGKTSLYDERMKGWNVLVSDLRILDRDEDKLNLIEHALTLDLFTRHRSDYIITGAFGNTFTMNMINILKETLEKRIRGEDTEDEFKICCA